MRTEPPFEAEDIRELLPHREPFLFVDRVTRYRPGRSIEAERALRPEEPQFAGHFPGRPIMPGVLVAEALAQTSGLLLGLGEALATDERPEKPKIFFLAATDVKFTHPAEPGQTLILRAETESSFGALHRFKVEATAGRNQIARGTLTLAQVE